MTGFGHLGSAENMGAAAPVVDPPRSIEGGETGAEAGTTRWISSGAAAAWRTKAGDDLLGGYALLIVNDRRTVEHDGDVPHCYPSEEEET